jgi:hypothetical protein
MAGGPAFVTVLIFRAGGAAFDLPGGRSFAGFEGAEGLTFLLGVGNSVDGVNRD